MWFERYAPKDAPADSVLTWIDQEKRRHEVSKPWCALPHIEAEHRHAAAHGLCAHGLVAPAWELLAVCVSVTLDCPPLEERAPPATYPLNGFRTSQHASRS